MDSVNKPVRRGASIEIARSWKSFLGSLVNKESACNVGDAGSIPELGRSPGGGKGYLLQGSCLGESHGQRSLVGYCPRVTKSGTRLLTKPRRRLRAPGLGERKRRRNRKRTVMRKTSPFVFKVWFGGSVCADSCPSYRVFV